MSDVIKSCVLVGLCVGGLSLVFVGLKGVNQAFKLANTPKYPIGSTLCVNGFKGVSVDFGNRYHVFINDLGERTAIAEKYLKECK